MRKDGRRKSPKFKYVWDMSLCEKLFSEIKNASVIVAESGIYEHSQLKELHAQGADAFLIGEHFMRQEDLAKAVKTVKEG